MGILREDKEKRVAWMERGFRYFEAPAAIAIGYADWNFSANKVESLREPIDNVITWRGL